MHVTSDGIRKQNLAITDEAIVNQLLDSTRIGYLGLVDGDEPYVVPLNYIWYKDAIYVHGAQYGRKAEVMKNNPKATFTVVDDRGTIAHPVPANTDTAYISAMIFGRVSIVTDLTEATEALDAMLTKYVPGYYSSPLHSGHVASYVSGAGSQVAVYRLNADRITAKQNIEEMGTLFYPGRTQKEDVRRRVEENKKE